MSPDDTGHSEGGGNAFIVSRRLTLHLGVMVVPYRSNSAKVSAMTTGDVAEILEAKYGILGAYAMVHQQDIAAALEVSLGGAMESLMMGRAVDPWGRASQMIQQGMRDFINSKEVEAVGLVGVPTKAALAGISHRRKHAYRRSNPRRPSFRDTGLMISAYRAWVD